MWLTLILAIAVFFVAVAGMAAGVIISNRRLRGSCGGLANLRDAQGRTFCDACTNPSPTCSGLEDAARRSMAVTPSQD